MQKEADSKNKKQIPNLYKGVRIVIVIIHGLKPGDSASRLVQYFNWIVSAQDLVKPNRFVGTCVTHLGL